MPKLPVSKPLQASWDALTPAEQGEAHQEYIQWNVDGGRDQGDHVFHPIFHNEKLGIQAAQANKKNAQAAAKPKESSVQKEINRQRENRQQSKEQGRDLER